MESTLWMRRLRLHMAESQVSLINHITRLRLSLRKGGLQKDHSDYQDFDIKAQNFISSDMEAFSGMGLTDADMRELKDQTQGWETLLDEVKEMTSRLEQKRRGSANQGQSLYFH